MGIEREDVRDYLITLSVVLLSVAAWIGVLVGVVGFVFLPRPDTTGGWLALAAFPASAVLFGSAALVLWRSQR